MEGNSSHEITLRVSWSDGRKKDAYRFLREYLEAKRVIDVGREIEGNVSSEAFRLVNLLDDQINEGREPGDKIIYRVLDLKKI